MRPGIAVIIVAATIFALIAGSFVMTRMMDFGNHANCLTAIPGQPPCSGNPNPFQSASEHINALLGASLAIVDGLLVVFLVSLALLAWLAMRDAAQLLPVIADRVHISAEKETTSIHKQRRWISLLEKRDPSFAYAMN